MAHFGLARIDGRMLVDLLGDGVAQQQDKRFHFVHETIAGYERQRMLSAVASMSQIRVSRSHFAIDALAVAREFSHGLACRTGRHDVVFSRLVFVIFVAWPQRVRIYVES